MNNNPSTWEGQKAFWRAVKKTGSTKAQDIVAAWRHEELEDARTNARLDAQAEREDQIQHERGDNEP